LNPGVQFISTGETYNIIKKADYNVIEMGVYTGYPEIKTGLVKSLHPKIHAGILGHLKTADDSEFMREHGIPAIDAVIVNFYDLQNAVEGHHDFESIRQAIDIGGPTLCHSSRKAFISTAVMASIESYHLFLIDIEKHHGCVSLSCRLKLAKETSSIYTKLMLSVDSIFQNVDFDELTNCYHIN
jgi:phosphoribosylaminoimidazolecarboxamide formyltransferase/IMP cyclohydrolase